MPAQPQENLSVFIPVDRAKQQIARWCPSKARPGLCSGWQTLILCRCRSVGDPDLYRELLTMAATVGAAQWSRPEIIQTNGNPHMGIRTADAVCRVESDPAELRYECLRPGVPGILLADAVAAAEIAADVARRDAEVARGRDEDVGEVLTDAALERERFRGRG